MRGGFGREIKNGGVVLERVGRLFGWDEIGPRCGLGGVIRGMGWGIGVVVLLGNLYKGSVCY